MRLDDVKSLDTEHRFRYGYTWGTVVAMWVIGVCELKHSAPTTILWWLLGIDVVVLVAHATISLLCEKEEA